jgi:hypothetical protein
MIMAQYSTNDDSEEKPQNLVQLRENRMRERNKRLSGYQYTQQMQQQETMKARRKEATKQTYPVCLSYFEPHNIAIFGLVSKEI